MKVKHKNKHIKHHIIKTNKTHSNKLNKMTLTYIRTSYIPNPNNNSKILEIKAINMKYLKKIRKPIPFLKD